MIDVGVVPTGECMAHLCMLANVSIPAADPAAALEDVGMDMDDKGGNTPKKKRRAGKCLVALSPSKDNPPSQSSTYLIRYVVHLSMYPQTSQTLLTCFQDMCTPCQLNGMPCVPQVGKPTTVACAECWSRKTKCHEHAK